MTIALSRGKIAYLVLQEKYIEETRKILEYIYRDTDKEILLYTMKRPNEEERGASISRNEETFIVKAEGSTYADLLKKISRRLKCKGGKKKQQGSSNDNTDKKLRGGIQANAGIRKQDIKRDQ